MTYFTVMDSPVGPLMLLSDGTHLTGLYMDGHKCGPAVCEHWTRNDALTVFAVVREQLNAYFAGELTQFNVPLAPAGTPFQREVWNALQGVPHGTTVSYAELARRVGRPGAARAVGSANGANPVSIIVPCHRVVGANGTLSGYAGGTERKQFLLGLEAEAMQP